MNFVSQNLLTTFWVYSTPLDFKKSTFIVNMHILILFKKYLLSVNYVKFIKFYYKVYLYTWQISRPMATFINYLWTFVQCI